MSKTLKQFCQSLTIEDYTVAKTYDWLPYRQLPMSHEYDDIYEKTIYRLEQEFDKFNNELIEKQYIELMAAWVNVKMKLPNVLIQYKIVEFCDFKLLKGGAWYTLFESYLKRLYQIKTVLERIFRYSPDPRPEITPLFHRGAIKIIKCYSVLMKTIKLPTYLLNFISDMMSFDNNFTKKF